ncbi:hypothetical protein KJ742_02035 [Patescibacteria group bacterium]|nr:hypothetical protein [Patescibacteria group bacterium]
MSFFEFVLIIISFWLLSIGIYELFAGVVFWGKFLKIHISENGNVFIARLIGLVCAISGGILLFSYNRKVNWGGGIGVFFLLGAFAMILQSFIVIVFGERGMSKRFAELLVDFRDSINFIDKNTDYEMPTRIWGLIFFLIFVTIFICVISGMT